MRFSLKGPSHVLSTGCTSSTDAIGYAYQHIQASRLTRVLCGGMDAPIPPATMAGFALMKVISRRFNDMPSQASRPFSRDRDGFGTLSDGLKKQCTLYAILNEDYSPADLKNMLESYFLLRCPTLEKAPPIPAGGGRLASAKLRR